MNILFLCNKSPWPPKEGGPMAMNMLIGGLTDAGHMVKVLAVNSYKYNIHPGDIPVSYRNKTGIELIDVDLHIRPLAAFFNLFTGRSYHVERFISESFRNRLAGILKTTRFDIVQIETVFMCPYIGTIREYSTAKIVLRAHNIEHRIWDRIAGETKNPVKRWYLGHLAKTLKSYEECILNKTDGVLAITHDDAAFFHGVFAKQHIHSIPVTDIPYGVDPDRYSGSPVNVEFPSLCSLGSMNWIPNQDGIRWFLTNVWPDVHKQFPELKYYLAGRAMPAWMLSLQLPNVVVVGEVEDAIAFLSSKAIMIVPLFSGSGIRVKIIEAMAAAKTVISTSIGAAGIKYTNRENILIADIPCEFFEMISICVIDHKLCSKIGKQARMLVESGYRQKILIEKLLAFYQQLGG